MTAELDAGELTLSVHNEGVIPQPIQLQIFQRSFSTKSGDGRGVGTYSVKLLAERYLKGDVQFVSNERLGTLFVIVIPDPSALAQPRGLTCRRRRNERQVAKAARLSRPPDSRGAPAAPGGLFRFTRGAFPRIIRASPERHLHGLVAASAARGMQAVWSA